MPKNKVKYGLKNVHAAVVTFDDNGYPTFGFPKRIPGAVNLSLDKSGDPTEFYADDDKYFVVNNNNGYSGDLEIALVPEWFKTEILKETKDSNGVLLEDADAQSVHFALMFEFTADQKAIRHVLYNNTVTRPKLEGKTREDSTEVKTDTLTLNAAPCKFNIGGSDVRFPKASSGDDTTTTAYNNWYSAVYIPDQLPTSIQISGGSTVAVNAELTLTAITVPEDADVNWASSDTDVATVTAGVVEGVAAGTVRITAELDDDPTKFDTKIITVTAS